MNTSIPLLDLHREYEQIAAELQQEWAETLRRMHLLNGEQVRLFEEEIARYIGVPKACAVASGTDALLLGMNALGIRAGDRVVLPANAFVAALEAIHHLGAIPALVDTMPDSFAPDPAAIERLLPAPAIVIVHLYGHCFDLEPLISLCEGHSAALVEDASHAHGAARHGRRAGSFGSVGCFSAGIVKNLAAYGDAGFVTTADAKIAETVGLLQRHGQQKKNEHVLYGYNSRLDEMQAAVLRVKLRHLEVRNARRRAIAAHYNDRFAPLGIRVPREDDGEIAVYHQYVIRSPQRTRLQGHLRERGIDTGVHYPHPLHRQPAWLRTYGETPPFPHCERLAGEILSLPVFPDLSDAEVERVTAGVVSFFQ